uniref:Uncharacterized protein n=1 Tax=Rhizophagus irregularis (strain DAOM 181602 / DAOM 197198 / MUCL 43194) TaxID=747089 RepID=U9SWS2_RHIID
MFNISQYWNDISLFDRMNDTKSRKTFLSTLEKLIYERFRISILMIKRMFHPGHARFKKFYIKEHDTAVKTEVDQVVMFSEMKSKDKDQDKVYRDTLLTKSSK